MAENTRYASFMIRLWRQPDTEVADQAEPLWMGELESIQSGHVWQFQGLERLLTLLARQLAADPPAPDSVDERE